MLWAWWHNAVPSHSLVFLNGHIRLVLLPVGRRGQYWSLFISYLCLISIIGHSSATLWLSNKCIWFSYIPCSSNFFLLSNLGRFSSPRLRLSQTMSFIWWGYRIGIYSIPRFILFLIYFIYARGACHQHNRGHGLSFAPRVIMGMSLLVQWLAIFVWLYSFLNTLFILEGLANIETVSDRALVIIHLTATLWDKILSSVDSELWQVPSSCRTSLIWQLGQSEQRSIYAVLRAIPTELHGVNAFLELSHLSYFVGILGNLRHYKLDLVNLWHRIRVQ